MTTVFIGVPTYSEDMNSGTARALYCTASRGDDVRVIPATRSSSLIPGSCNNLWCEALNMRESHGIDWFGLLHADIEPEHFWLDKMLAIAEASQADMLSVCVPIKDDRGITSTAIASGDERTQFCRLTQRQLWHPDFPETFDTDQCADALERLPEPLGIPNCPRYGLRLNTGCMLLRLKPEFCDGSVYFENVDWIEQRNGLWLARDISEDWRFAQKVQAAGGRLVATRAVKAIHKGIAKFPNDVPWGLKPNDADIPTLEAAA